MGSAELIIPRKKSKIFYKIAKRILDILGGFVGCILSAPIMVIIIIAILIDDKESSPFFLQERIGKNGKKFKIFKFRTMVTNAEELLNSNPRLYAEFKKSGYKFPEGEDPRVTKMGYFLRKTSLDELPQFINVLIGNMSLVGPRPIVENELQEYKESKKIFLSAKPGITGWWQVSGRSEVGYPERCNLELEYVKNASIFFDIKILFLTVFSVLKGKGAV